VALRDAPETIEIEYVAPNWTGTNETIHCAGNYRRALGVYTNTYMRAITSAVVLLAIFSLATGRMCAQQSGAGFNGLSLRVTGNRHEAREYVTDVLIKNTSDHVLYLAESPHWRHGPRFLTLSVEQWSNGKTDLLSKGRLLSPCREVATENQWIRLDPGATLTDEIDTVDPSASGFLPNSCTWRAEHFDTIGKVTLSVNTERGESVRQQVMAFAALSK